MRHREFVQRVNQAILLIQDGWSFWLACHKAGFGNRKRVFRKFQYSKEFRDLHYWYYFQGRECTPPLIQNLNESFTPTQPMSGTTETSNATT